MFGLVKVFSGGLSCGRGRGYWKKLLYSGLSQLPFARTAVAKVARSEAWKNIMTIKGLCKTVIILKRRIDLNEGQI